MRVSVNLATRPFADIAPALKRLRIAMAVLALVAIGLGLSLRALHEQAEAARARDHSLDGQIAQITQERQGYQSLMRQPDNAKTLMQAQSLNKLFDEKAFSWTMAMEDLETVLPGGVQVTTIEPTSKDGKVSIRLRVIGPRDRAVDLVQNLEHSKRFLMPRITSENSESTGGPGERAEPVSATNKVDFDVLSDYSPASAEERKAGKARAATTGNSAATRHLRPHAPPVIGGEPGRRPYTGMPRPKAPVIPRPGGPQ